MESPRFEEVSDKVLGVASVHAVPWEQVGLQLPEGAAEQVDELQNFILVLSIPPLSHPSSSLG
ncbi:MAG: hypothetical protein HKL84_02490 [Acidimicrobiaceae bacterium]|nr:hypothetical protein [Acidimicrobiaceae bacterium]